MRLHSAIARYSLTALSLALIACGWLSPPASAQPANDSFWESTFGEPGLERGARVGTVVGGVLYMSPGIGAGYPSATDRSMFAVWDGSSWDLDGVGSIPQNEGIQDMVAIGSDIYVAGSFTSIGTEGIAYVARWDGSEWHALGEGVNDRVAALATDGQGTLYVGGIFTEAGGEAVRNIASWDGTSWSPLGDEAGSGNGVNGGVAAIAVGNNRVYVGGGFTEAGQQATTSVASWNWTTGDWEPLGGGVRREGFATAGVSDIGVSGDVVYVAGDMDWASNEGGEIPIGNVAVYTDGTWEAMGLGSAVPVLDLLVTPGGAVFASGDFSSPPTTRYEGIAEWTGAAWVPLNPDEYAWQVDDIIWYDGEVVALGAQFPTSEIGSVRTNGIARWTGSEWRGLGLGIGGAKQASPAFPFPGAVSALVEHDGALYAGGNFFAAGDTEVRSLARLASDDWETVGEGLPVTSQNLQITALASTSAGLVAGGFFGEIGGTTVKNVALWDGNAWNTMGDGLDDFSFTPAVKKLQSMDGELYAGGSFFRSGAATVRGIARWTGSVWEAVGNGAQEVETFAASGGQIVVGTAAATLSVDYGPDGNGVPTQLENVALWDGATWSGVGGGVTGGVHALAFDGAAILVGGVFSQAGGVSASNLARWDGSTWTAFGGGVNGRVRAIHVNGSDVYVGGDFTQAGGIEVNGLARWDGSAWHALGSGVANVRLVNSPPLSVGAFAGTTAGLYVGGEFTFAGSRPSSHIALWTDYSPFGVAIGGEPDAPGHAVALASNYPNPFSQATTLRFELSSPTDVQITVFDLLGRRMATALPRTSMPAGSHEIPFDGSTLSQGVYVYRLSAGSATAWGRLLVIR